MTQTAVEWLFNKIENVKIIDGYEWIKLQEAFKQSKAMEMEHIMQSLNDGKAMALGNLENKSLEQYYNETFNTEEE